MADSQLVASGSFTSTGAQKLISLRSDFDIMRVVNFSIAAADTPAGAVVRSFWQKGMAAGGGVCETRANGGGALSMIQYVPGTNDGFIRVDAGDQSVGAPIALSGTEITAATSAVATTATAHGYVVGDRVVFSGTTGQLQAQGIPFEISAVPSSTSFTIKNYDTSGLAAASAGSVRKLPRKPLFFPEKLYITKMSSSGVNTVVTFSVTHNLQVGGYVVFNVSTRSGFSAINGLRGKIVAIGATDADTTNTITVDINSAAFGAWAWPTNAALVANPRWTQPHTVMDGEAATVLSMAEVNNGEIQMLLAGGAASPAGANGNVIYWEALKSGYVLNE